MCSNISGKSEIEKKWLEWQGVSSQEGNELHII
jgi:hypothetical protein